MHGVPRGRHLFCPSISFLFPQRALASKQKITGGDVLANCQSVASGVITQVLCLNERDDEFLFVLVVHVDVHLTFAGEPAKGGE